jgi:hypothetical protein
MMANNPPFPDEPVPVIPVIKDSGHLNQLIGSAQSDNHLWAIKQQMKKQGLWTGNLGFRFGGKVSRRRLDRKTRRA